MIDRLAAVLRSEPCIAYALLFGSAARGTSHAGSDLDVALGLHPGAALAPLELGELAARLEEAGGRPVDLVLLDEAPPALAYRVFRDGTILLERDHAALVERKARAILDYLDFRPIETLFTRRVLEAAAGGR